MFSLKRRSWGCWKVFLFSVAHCLIPTSKLFTKFFFPSDAVNSGPENKREREPLGSGSDTGSCFGFDGITLGVLKSAHSITFPRLRPKRGLLWFVPCLVLLALSAAALPLKYAAPQSFRGLICRYDRGQLNPRVHSLSITPETGHVRWPCGLLWTGWFQLLDNYIKPGCHKGLHYKVWISPTVAPEALYGVSKELYMYL